MSQRELPPNVNAIPQGDRSWKLTPIGVLPESEEKDLRFQVEVNMANAKMTPLYPPVGLQVS